MKNWLDNLWIKIWRMWRKKFFLKHLYMLLLLIILLIIVSWLFVSCWSGINLLSCTSMVFMVWLLGNLYIILIPLYLLSNFYLAKRFQDCWICGIRAFVLWILILILSGVINSYLNSLVLYSLLNLLYLLYPIILIVMCFIKWDTGSNKYGDAV